MPTVVIDSPGPLPIEKKVTPTSTKPSLIFITGSVWSQTIDDQKIGIILKINDVEVTRSEIFANPPSLTQHNTTTPVMITYQIPFELDKKGNPKPVTFLLDHTEKAVLSDQNDHYNVTIMD